MSWKYFEESAPVFAALGSDRIDRRICYLALLDQDGAPRIHPITPFIGAGMLFMFTKADSPKIRDLMYDPRYALHNNVAGEEPLLEFLVYGEALLISDQIVRDHAVKSANTPIIDDTFTLFNFQVNRVLVVQYDESGNREVLKWSR